MRILDTDHCVAALRQKLDFRAHISPSEVVGVTVISVAELIHGAHRSAKPVENLAAVDVLLTGLVILPFDEVSARNFGQLKASLQTSGILIEDLDLQIASIVLHHSGTLVTHNTKHFRRINGLALEDWL